MAKKFQLTGFARLLIALVFIVPISYFAASYYTGEDGKEELENMFAGKKETTESQDNIACEAKIKALEASLKEKEARIEDLYDRNQSLQKDLADKATEKVEELEEK